MLLLREAPEIRCFACGERGRLVGEWKKSKMKKVRSHKRKVRGHGKEKGTCPQQTGSPSYSIGFACEDKKT